MSIWLSSLRNDRLYFPDGTARPTVWFFAAASARGRVSPGARAALQASALQKSRRFMFFAPLLL